MSAHATVTQGLSLDSTVVSAPQQVSTVLGEEMVILQVDDGVYYGLAAVGRSVWELIRQPRTVRELRDRLLDEYDVEAGRCERDLLELLQEMSDRRLIEVHRTGPRGGERGERGPP